MSRTWFTSAERLRSCHPSATHTSFLYMKVKVCCMSRNTHIHTWQNTHKQKHKCPKSTSPSAHSPLVANLQDCHVMTRRCHNKTWTTALGCYSSLLGLAAWACKSLDGFDGVHLDVSAKMCACTCVLKVCV